MKFDADRVTEVQRDLLKIKTACEGVGDLITLAVIQATYRLIDDLYDELRAREPAVNGTEFQRINGYKHERWTAKGPWVPTGEDAQ